MTLEDFLEISRDYVDHERPLTLADVLDAAYCKAIAFDKPRLWEKRMNGRVARNLVWLELAFFAETPINEIDFFGVQPVLLDMRQAGAVTEYPVMTLDQPAPLPQTLDWEAALDLCATFNGNLPYPGALPFVRIAVDETRTTSLYHRLRDVEYP